MAEKEPTFEEAFGQLEQIVAKLEEGEPSLDDSVKAYEEGIELVKLCMKKLNEAEKKMQKLLESEDGSFQLELMD